MINVIVSIVNYESADLTAACVRSLTDPRIREIRLWDNSESTHEQTALLDLAARDARIRIRSNGRNLGFGRGHNANLEDVIPQTSSYLWILNPDTQPGNHTLEELLLQFDRSKSPVILSPTILFMSSGSPKPRTWFTRGSFNDVLIRVQHDEFGTTWVEPQGEVSGVSGDFLPGTALFMSSLAWSEIGGFDEALFLYWEDVDFSLRARSLGYELQTAARSVLLHQEGGSQRQDSDHGTHGGTYYYWNNFGRQVIAAKHGRRGIGETLLRFAYDIAYITRPIRKEKDAAKTLASLQGAVKGFMTARTVLGVRSCLRAKAN